MNFRTGVTFILAAAGLSACMSSPPPRYERSMSPPPQASASPVDGGWADANGLVSTFQAGNFNTRTTDGTNTLLASGNYIQKSDRLFEINMTSHVRNTQSRVNCALVTPSQLNCTSEAGGQFTLTRRG